MGSRIVLIWRAVICMRTALASMTTITGILLVEEWLRHLSPLLSPPWNPLPCPRSHPQVHPLHRQPVNPPFPPHLLPLPHPHSKPPLLPLRKQQNLDQSRFVQLLVANLFAR